MTGNWLQARLYIVKLQQFNDIHYIKYATRTSITSWFVKKFEKAIKKEKVRDGRS